MTTIIKIKEPHRNVLINIDYISSINYVDYSLAIIMNNGDIYHLTDKKQIKNILDFLNPKIIEV